ncbi:MAG: hypothetical protein R2795_20390 [Saprospiraceae bacterium]
MPWNEPHSLLYYLLLLALGAGVAGSLGIGSLYFLKRTGIKRANFFYGLLLISIGLTLLHNIFYITGFYDFYPQYKFFPIYFTLAFPVLLFFHVKLSLYPQYRIRLSDVKHFLLPVLQWLFFWQVFFTVPSEKLHAGRYFYNPFYGGLEQAIYLVAFFAYLYFAYRYVYQRRSKRLTITEGRKVWYLSKLLKGLFVLFGIHTAFVLADFFCYEFLFINLRAVKIYAGLGALSFAALVYFLSVYGFQVLFWGRKRFGNQQKW